MRTMLRSKVTLLFMTLGMLLALPAIALADTISADPDPADVVVVENNVNKAPGDTGSAKVWLTVDDNSTDPVNGCNANTTNNVSITLSSNDPDVTFDSSGTKANPALLEGCGSAVGKEIGYTVSSSATGPFPKTVTVTASGSGGRVTGSTSSPNIPAYNPDTFTITITTPPKQNQTISFAGDTPTSKTFGNADFNVSATATSNLQVSYAAKAGSSCTVSNAGLVHLTGAGTCTVVASQAGDASYNAAPNVEHAISVGKATPTITWNNPPDITYPTALSGTQLNATAQGVGGGSLAGSFVYNPAAGAVLDAGTHQLDTTFTPTNTTDYTNATANVSLVVNQASQSINFTSQAPNDAIYGSTYTPTATGGGSNNPVTFGASGDCSYDSGVVTMDAAGTCTVTADQDGNTNYSAAPQASQVFSVGKRPVTVTPNSGQSKVYGNDDPNLAYTVTSGSVINNDPFSGSLGRAAGNDVGSYVINLGTLSLGNNYALSLSSTPVNFEITQRPITVKAANVSRVYGDSTPAFSLALHSGTLGYTDTLADSFGTQVQFTPEGTTVGQHYIDVSGLSNGNYNISYATGNDRGVLTITQRPITGSFTAADKVWDGTTTATVTSRSLIGVLGNDVVSLSGGTANFNNPDVGANKPVTLTGATLTGADAFNYSLSSVSNATASITNWGLNGFYQPVDMNGTYNTVKSGSTVPLKFEAFAGSTELTNVATTIGAPNTNGSSSDVKQTKINCDGSAPTDDIEATTTGNTSLRYDSTAGQFIFNWQTPSKAANQCYKVTVPFKDGSSLVAYFKLK